jgi:hypothetical protein
MKVWKEKWVLSKIKDDMVYARNDVEIKEDIATGLLQGVNKFTGEIVWTQKTDKAPPTTKGPQERKHTVDSHYIEFVDDDGKRIKLPYNPKFLKFHKSVWPYMEELGLDIARRIAEGETMKEICSSEGMPPYYVVAKWRATIPEFRNTVEEARRMRAEMYHDELHTVVKEVTESTAKSSKVKVDGYKHLAAVNDPDSYSGQKKDSFQAPPSLTFIFNTGIERKPQIENNPPIEVEGGTVNAEEEGDAT